MGVSYLELPKKSMVTYGHAITCATFQALESSTEYSGIYSIYIKGFVHTIPVRME